MAKDTTPKTIKKTTCLYIAGAWSWFIPRQQTKLGMSGKYTAGLVTQFHVVYYFGYYTGRLEATTRGRTHIIVNIKEGPQELSNIIKHHQTSSNIIKHHQTSSNIIKHHQTSSNIIKHHQTSSNIIKHHQTSSNITNSMILVSYGQKSLLFTSTQTAKLEVEKISGRLAEVQRSCHDFGEEPQQEARSELQCCSGKKKPAELLQLFFFEHCGLPDDFGECFRFQRVVKDLRPSWICKKLYTYYIHITCTHTLTYTSLYIHKQYVLFLSLFDNIWYYIFAWSFLGHERWWLSSPWWSPEPLLMPAVVMEPFPKLSDEFGSNLRRLMPDGWIRKACSPRFQDRGWPNWCAKKKRTSQKERRDCDYIEEFRRLILFGLAQLCPSV